MAVRICPAHALGRVIRDRQAATSDLDDAGKLPLFPNLRGLAKSASEVRGQLRVVLGSPSVSEHSLRRMGAQFYARRGVGLAIIQHLGRWGSSAIERYVDEALAGRAAWAPLMAAGSWNLEAAIGTHGPPGAGPDLGALAGLVHELVRSEVRRSTADITRDAAPAAQPHEVVVGGRSGIAHIARHGGSSLARGDWETACGWRYGHRPHTLDGQAPITCRRCMAAAVGQ